VPLGEDHTLGAYVLAAQLRRLGARVDMSFCESHSDLVSRFLCNTADVVLFTASCSRTLENISRIVQDFRLVSSSLPPMVVGGCLSETSDEAKDISGADVVTRDAKEVIKLASGFRRSSSGHISA
jgi:methylmalonyl-CoA mutase cobalamin-binding subunit